MMRNIVDLVLLAAITYLQSETNGLKCGSRPLDEMMGRVVGGDEALYGQVPWQALIKESRFFGLLSYRKCGGVLISDRFILTAAHCQAGWFGSLDVILGEHDIRVYQENPNRTVALRKAKRVEIHPQFSRLRLENDIAIIELEEKVTFDFNIQPICLPQVNEDFSNTTGYVSGWGKTSYSKLGFSKLASILQIAKVPILSSEMCREMYQKAGYNRDLNEDMVCAGYEEGGKDSCEGDSGGPLMVQRNDSTWVLVGIVSNGIHCAEPNLPGVYMKVSKYINWIESYLDDDDAKFVPQ